MGMVVELEESSVVDFLSTKTDVSRVETRLTRQVLEVKTDLTGKISDVKTELTAKISETNQRISETNERISQEETRLTKEISEVKTELKGEIVAVNQGLKGEITTVNQGLKAEIAKNQEEVKGMMNEFRKENKQQFMWIVGTVVITLLALVLTVLLTNGNTGQKKVQSDRERAVIESAQYLEIVCVSIKSIILCRFTQIHPHKADMT